MGQAITATVMQIPETQGGDERVRLRIATPGLQTQLCDLDRVSSQASLCLYELYIAVAKTYPKS